ncbi:MAG: hypothetical protein M0D55_01585 [Elusimicrobiota bacterium]|nr:MAG: hypothetical protein M0D55_01585 [Elusimicrobiota bacterium]
MLKAPARRALAAAALTALTSLWPQHSADAATRTLGTGGANTAYVGQRNVLFIPGRGYWAFFKSTNSDRVVWRWSLDGQDWSAKDDSGNWTTQADAIPFLQTAPNAAWSFASIWYAPDLNRIYVSAADALGVQGGGGGSTTNGRTGDTSGDLMFIRWGTPQADGSIVWNSTIRQQRMTVRANACQNVSNGGNQTWDPLARHSALIVYSSGTTASSRFVAVAADTNRNNGGVYDGGGSIVTTNLTIDVTGYHDTGGVAPINVYTYCHETTGANSDSTLDIVAAPTLTPSRDGANGRVILISRNDNLTVGGDSNADAAVVTLGHTSRDVTAVATDANMNGTVYQLTATDENEGWGASSINEEGTSITHFTYINQNGDLAYRRRTSQGVVTGAFDLDTRGTSGAGGLPLYEPAISLTKKNQTWVNNDLYIAYVSTGRTELHYMACRSTATALASGCDTTRVFRTGVELNNPKLGFWGERNEPMPIMWSDVDKVYFDKIITSTFAIPSVTVVSTAAAYNAFLTQPNYDVIITGANFEFVTGVSTPTPRFQILASSETQADVTVTSVTYIGKTSMRASIVPSTSTVRIQFQRESDGFVEPEISVASMVYAGNTVVSAYVRASTQAQAGRYTIILTNPSSGTAVSPPAVDLGATFYITVPTATITSPGPGNNLGFAVVTGTVGFNNEGQTVISTAAVRVTHVATGKVWNGSVMTTSGFADEEAKWRPASLSPAATAYNFTFDTSNVGNIPDDGPYEIAARAQTRDGGIGDPYNPAMISTVGINLDRFAPTATMVAPYPPPTVTAATNSITAISFQFADAGTGVIVSSIMIQDIGMPTGAPNTWIAFTTAGALGLPDEQIWLATTTADASRSIFGTGQVGAVNMLINNATSIKLPQWENGRKYAISAYSRDAASRFVNTSTSGTSAYTIFVYDTQIPTVTVVSPIGLASSSGTATWVTSFSSVTGKIQDNVSDSLDQQFIHVRIARLAPGAAETVERWFDPNTLDFDNTSLTGLTAYKNLPGQTLTAPNAQDNWAWDFSSAINKFDDGRTYRIEVYANDGAGNSTGTAVSPAHRYYLRLDKNAPSFTSIVISTGGPFDNTSSVLPNTLTVGMYGSSNPLTTIRANITDGTGSGITSVQYSLRFDGANGGFHFVPTDPSSWVFQGAPTYVNATSSTTPQFAVSITSSVPWLDSQNYFLSYIVTDLAGNTTTYYWDFRFDRSPPTLSNIMKIGTYSISSGTFRDPNQLPSVIDGIVKDEIDGQQNAGVQSVSVGVQRMSDGFWYRSPLIPRWTATRNDPAATLGGGNSWSLPIGGGAGLFWDNKSTETFALYVWTKDNVVAPFDNATSSTSLVTALKGVFKWEVQAPSSTLTSPSTVGNNVWFSSHVPFNLPRIAGTAFDQPSSGPGAGGDASCSMPGASGWPGGSYNICAEQVEIQDTANGKCWDGSAFNATCGDVNAYRAMTVFQSSYTYDTQIGVPGGLWESFTPGGQYRIRMRGKDSAVTASGIWDPNTEDPGTPTDCNSVAPGSYNIRCIRVDKTAPATVVTNPVHNSDITAPVSTFDGTATDSGSGLGKTFIMICQDLAGAPDLTKCLTGDGTLAPTAGSTFTGPPNWFERPGAASWSLNTNAVTAWTVGVFYHAIVRSTDNVNNMEQWNAGAANNTNHVRFRIVAPGAGGVITKPSIADTTYPFYTPTTLTTISGTAVGNTHSQIRIRETDNNLYYDNNAPGAGWIAVSTWITSPTGALISVVGRDWLHAFGGSWRVNQNYTVEQRVCNSVEAGCSGVLPGSETFVIDSSAPVNSVTNPSLAAHRAGTMASLSGTIADPSAPGQPNSLNASSPYFRVVRMKDAREWAINASTFVAPPGDNLLASDQGGGLFTYTTTYLTSELMFEDGYQYRANLTAADKAGNSATGVGAIFRYDISLPTAAMTVPIPTVVINTLPTISGTARDPNPKLGDSNSSPSGMAAVEVLIQRQFNGFYFNGTNFGSAVPVWLNSTGFYESAPGVATFTYTNANLDASLQSGLYTIAVRARDVAGNTQTQFTAANSSFTITVDKDAPTIAISQPILPAYTPAAASALGIQGTAADPLINGTSSNLLAGGVDVLLWHVIGPTSWYWTGGAFSTTLTTVSASGTSWSMGLVPSPAQYAAGEAAATRSITRWRASMTSRPTPTAARRRRRATSARSRP